MDLLKHKGYEGTAEVDVESGVCYGRVLFIQDLITYESDTPKALKDAFCDALDDYLETCESLGKSPDKPLKGAFNVRIPPELHKAAVLRAMQSDLYLNDIVVKALDAYLNGTQHVNHVTNYFVQNEETQYKKVVASDSKPSWEHFTSHSSGVQRGN